LKEILFAMAAIATVTSASFAADDPIVARKALMDSNHAAYDASKAMMDGTLSYSPIIAKAAIMTLNASAHSIGSFFPEGSGPGETTASPKIWEDMDGFNRKLQEYRSAVASAIEATGASGPEDLDAFKSAIGPVFSTCRSCHQVYRQ
jgi:cytochrome c556